MFVLRPLLAVLTLWCATLAVSGQGRGLQAWWPADEGDGNSSGGSVLSTILGEQSLALRPTHPPRDDRALSGHGPALHSAPQAQAGELALPIAACVGTSVLAQATGAPATVWRYGASGGPRAP